MDGKTTACVYVPGGHGRYSQYFCTDCHVVFPWGSNKFGDITKATDIKKVFYIGFTDQWPITGKEYDANEARIQYLEHRW